MNPAELARGLMRRWYITFPGIALAIAISVGVWITVPPAYERSATQLLLPGEASMPVDSNPLLFLGGLSYATDVLVRAVGAENVLAEVAVTHPDAEVVVTRDGSGPFIVITVTAATGQEAGEVLDLMVASTAEVLENIQETEAIASDNRISVVPITVDAESVVQQRDRLVATAGAGIAVLALSLFLASFVDGLMRQRRKPTATGVTTEDADSDVNADDTDEASERESLTVESEPETISVSTETQPTRVVGVGSRARAAKGSRGARDGEKPSGDREERTQSDRGRDGS